MTLIGENLPFFMLETLYFTIFCRMDNLHENNQQKFIIVLYIENIYKNLFARFWCYRVYPIHFHMLDNRTYCTSVDSRRTWTPTDCIGRSVALKLSEALICEITSRSSSVVLFLMRLNKAWGCNRRINILL